MIFANPLFLWGLLALDIPIAVHLFQFRRYKKVYFSNVERLGQLETESRRQSTLRRWLVLLMRCLAIVFLVLAFAQPTMPGKGQILHSGSTVVSVYVDNSFSMENSGTDGSQLEVAKQKAREIVAAYRPGDRYQLLSNAMVGDEFRWLSREEFLDAVDELQITSASRRLGEVAARQDDFMHQSGAANRHAYIISDFQRAAANFEAIPDLSAFFTLVPLEGQAADNIYIDTLRLDAPAYFVGGSVTVEATVRNGGASGVEKLPVKLVVNGRERALATVDIPAGGTVKASLHFAIDSAGWLDGRVELTDYPVTFDDSYFFALQAGESIGMLEVDGVTPNKSMQKLFSDDSAISYSQATSLMSDLSPLDFIILNEGVDLPSGQVQALAAWVEKGGTLTVVPPADGKVESLNNLLTMVQAPRLDRWVKRPVKASTVDFQSSLYRGVFNGTSDEMEVPTVQGHYLLSDQGAVRQTVISLTDGSSLLSSTPYGQGRLFLFSAPLTEEWTDFVAQALFVPTLYNMALYSRPQPVVAHTLGDNSPVFVQGGYDVASTPPKLSALSSQFSFLPDLRRVGGRSALVLHNEISVAGHYILGDSEHLAFNYPRTESWLEFLSRDEIEVFTETHQNFSSVRNAAKPLDQEIRSRERGSPLWCWCLLIALAALLAETLLLKLCSFRSKK